MLAKLVHPYLRFSNQIVRMVNNQWNPDAIGEITFVLYQEVSFIQGFLNYDVL